MPASSGRLSAIMLRGMKQNFTVGHGLLGNARWPVRHGRGAAQARRKRKAECKGRSMSPIGTTQTLRDVRSPVAIGGQADLSPDVSKTSKNIGPPGGYVEKRRTVAATPRKRLHFYQQFLGCQKKIERVRCPRAVSQTAPGRLWATTRPARRPVSEELGRLETDRSG